MGRTETFLNHLGGTQRLKGPDGKRYWVKKHPRLHWTACRLLDVMGWWHYRIQRNACSEGSRLCWDRTHWRNGVLGPLSAELDRQMPELDAKDIHRHVDTGGEQPASGNPPGDTEA